MCDIENFMKTWIDEKMVHSCSGVQEGKGRGGNNSVSPLLNEHFPVKKNKNNEYFLKSDLSSLTILWSKKNNYGFASYSIFC